MTLRRVDDDKRRLTDSRGHSKARHINSRKPQVFSCLGGAHSNHQHQNKDDYVRSISRRVLENNAQVNPQVISIPPPALRRLVTTIEEVNNLMEKLKEIKHNLEIEALSKLVIGGYPFIASI